MQQRTQAGKPRRHQHRRARRTTALLVAAVTAVALVGACSSSSDDGGGNESGGGGGTVTVAGRQVPVNKALAAQVPAKIRKAGVLKNISYNDSPPDESVVNGKLVGWNVDLGRAVAATLGLKWQAVASGAFDTFIPSLQNGRFNTAFSALFYTPERAKVVDMVTFLNAGTGFVTKEGSSISIKEPTDLCGHVLSFITGQSFTTKVPGVNALCKTAGKPAVKVRTYPTVAAVLLALDSGRTELWSSQYTAIAAVVKNAKDKFTEQSLVYLPSPEGVAITKGIGLTKPIADAINSLIASGVYKAILDKWDVRKGLVTKTTIYDS